MSEGCQPQSRRLPWCGDTVACRMQAARTCNVTKRSLGCVERKYPPARPPHDGHRRGLLSVAPFAGWIVRPTKSGDQVWTDQVWGQFIQLSAPHHLTLRPLYPGGWGKSRLGRRAEHDSALLGVLAARLGNVRSRRGHLDEWKDGRMDGCARRGPPYSVSPVNSKPRRSYRAAAMESSFRQRSNRGMPPSARTVSARLSMWVAMPCRW